MSYGTVATREPSGAVSLQIEVGAAPRRASFWAVAYMVLLGDSVRGIFFPTLWPLVSSLGGTRAHQGIIVAAFSLGRVLVSPWYGAHSTRHGYRGVLLFAHGVIVAGALLYTQVRGLASLFAAQVVLGLGCGTLGVTRAYVAESVPRDQRTVYLGRLTAMQYAGLTTTSFLGSLLSRCGDGLAARYGGTRAGALLRLDGLTFAAYAVLAGALAAVALLLAPTFVDFAPAARPPAAAAAAGAAPAPLAASDAAADRRHARLVAVGLVLNVVTKGSIGCYETLGVSYAQAELGLPGPVVGYYVSASGLVGVLFLLSFRPLGRLFDDVELVLYGIAVMVASCALMVRPVAAALGGGDAFQVWLTALFAMYAVGYPVGHTAVIGWFSKAMGRRPQGMLMGLFASAGSLARIVFPVCTGLVAVSFGSDAVFATLAALLGATLLIIAYFRAAFRGAIA